MNEITIWIFQVTDMEAASRFELENKGFADLCLTTWLCRPKKRVL